MKQYCYRLMWLLLALSLMQTVFGQSAGTGSVLNVMNFSAVGDGSADDTAAIQAAIDKATFGDTVYIPDGVYNISRSIALKAGIKITGQTQNNTIIKFGGESTYSMLGLSNVSSVEITSLTLDGNRRDITNAIFGENGRDHILHELTIKNLAHTGFGPHGILFSGDSQWQGGVTHSIISNNTFSNIGVDSEWGAAVRLANGSSYNQLLRNTITETGRGGILANEGSTDLIIQGNHITGIGKAYAGLSIEVHTECNRALIEDNVVEHWISLDKTNNSAIRRNKIVSHKSDDWKFAAMELAGGSNNIFTDNVADGGATHGISISVDYPKEYILWGRNTINHMADWGVQLQGGLVGLSYHYFYKNMISNTQRNHSQSAYPDQGHGFRVNGNSHHITLEDNIIKDNQGWGIEFNGPDIDQFTIINNTITGNTLAAVTSYWGKDLYWSNNNVSDNGSDAVPVSSGFIHSTLPIADFTSDATVKVNTPVAFSNASLSRNSAGNIAHVLWDFDDGLPSTELNPSYTYSKTGTYKVTLIVWDNKGRAARKEKTITVVPHSQLM